jgi:anti-sigma regulatory factor (Ser/Thr protein kinase)
VLDEHDALILATARETSLLASTAAHRTGLSRVAVSRRIKRLADSGYLNRLGSGTRQTYSPGTQHFWLASTTPEAVRRNGGESGIWAAHVAPLLAKYPAHAVALADIAFTETLNNALDHAQADQLLLAAHVARDRLQMLVADNGVGIFRQIAQALNLFDERLALLELAKGKFTTAASGHSGIGLYVTTRMMDGLAIQSGPLTFDLRTGDRALQAFDWVDVKRLLPGAAAGTTVRMDLDLMTTRTPQAVYDRYFSPDELGGHAFHTTEVPVRLAQLSSQLTSRSQGKWVVERATQFKTVILDFEGVSLVGQGFLDEVFRVFATAHPEVRMKPVNVVPAVARSFAAFAPHVALPREA